jgi:hypothetical protein
MLPETLFASTWVKVLTCYLMVGWATQLPGGLFRRYPAAWLIKRNYELHGPQALLQIPFIWIPFTILLWPVPFIRAGIKPAPAAAAMLGFIAGLVLVYWSPTIWSSLFVVVVAGLVPTLIFRPRIK